MPYLPSCSQCIHDDMKGTKSAYDRDSSPHSTPEVINSRMLPVLFAIKSHAERIVLTKDVSNVHSSMPRLFNDYHPDGVTGLEYHGGNLTLDSYHFHYRSELDEKRICQYRIRKCMAVLWSAGLQCRTTKEASISPDIMLDEQAPPVFASAPKFDVPRLDDALFEYNGFWAMFQVFVNHGDESSAWSLWAQRLMVELDAQMAVVVLPCPPKAPLTSAPNHPSRRSKSVFQTVNAWTCPAEMDFSRCAVSLALQLYQNGHVSRETLESLYLWLAELWAVNYRPPQRMKSRLCHDAPVKEGCIIYNPALTVSGGRGQLPAYNTPHKLFPAIETKCPNLPKRPDVFEPFKPYVLDPKYSSNVRDIALVVIFFDGTIYSNILYLEDLHRHYYSQIIYCGPDASRFSAFYRDLKKPISYIEVPPTQGFVAHDCVTRAMMLNYKVNGYLEIADDVILNSWTLDSIPRDRFWFQKDLRIASRNQKEMQDFAIAVPVVWWPWVRDDAKWGKKAMAETWKQFEKLRASGSRATKELVQVFLETLQHNSGKPENFFYCSSDIFYVPAIHRRSWIFLGDIFLKNNVFLDIAVPTLMNGMDLTGNIVRLDGLYLWYTDRQNYASRYGGFLNFFHPWKMGWIQKPQHANFMCSTILPFIVDDLAKKIIGSR